MSREVRYRAWWEYYHYMQYDVQDIHDEDFLRISCFGELLITPDIELMQFTGLHNRNGDEIWEGDIVEYEGHIWEVVWLEDSACFGIECLKEDLFNIFFEANSTDMFVIGNIYENPELLEVEE